MSDSDLTAKQILDMTKLVKIIRDSIQTYIENIKDPMAVPGKDISLYAMQVLSLMCGLNRGYSKDQLNQMWETSSRLSNKIHAANKSDRVDSSFQGASDSHYKN